MNDWANHRRVKMTDAQEKRLREAEKVELTPENIHTLAKKTGRTVFELEKFLSDAQSKGHVAKIRIIGE